MVFGEYVAFSIKKNKLEDIRTYFCGNRKNPAGRERLMQEKGDNEGLLYNKGINCVM